MDYEVHFVHSPSASGKTTFLKTGTSGPLTISRNDGDHVLPGTLFQHGDMGIVDGDDIIHHTIGWPPNKEWYKHRSATRVHSAQLFALVNTAVRLNAPSWMKHFVIMFNGGMKQIGVAQELYAHDRDSDSLVTLHHHTVVPNREDHERNIESRRQENLKEGRSWTFPANWGDAHNNRVSVEKLAEHFDLTVHTTFVDVLLEISPGHESVEKTVSRESEETEKGTTHITELEFEELKEYLLEYAQWTKEVTTYDPILKKDKTRTIGSGCWEMNGTHCAVSFNFSGQQVHVVASEPSEKDIQLNCFERWKDYRGGIQLTLTKLIHCVDNMSSEEIHTFIMSDEQAPKITDQDSQPEGERDRFRTWDMIKDQAGA
jgi:hypothetical protein